VKKAKRIQNGLRFFGRTLEFRPFLHLKMLLFFNDPSASGEQMPILFGNNRDDVDDV